MKNFIKIVESIGSLPEIVYHGTSDLNWQNNNAETLYLTISRSEAESYADEAVVNNYPEDYDETTPPPSVGIVVEFKLADLLALNGVTLSPDWGWDQASSDTSWKESLAAVGSFCVEGFSHADKALGTVTKAF